MTSFSYPDGKYILSESSITVLSGANALLHLQKLITSKVEDSDLYRTHDSLFCHANGRIIDYLKIYNFGEKILITNNNKNGNSIRKLIQTGIPWNEEMTITNGDNGICHYRLIGNIIDTILKQCGINKESIVNNKFTEYGNMILTISSGKNYQILDILIPSDEEDKVLKIFKNNNIKNMEASEWDKIRINLGIVDYFDIENSIPFEVNMEHLVKLDKGCYPGQEIHARIESRGKINKKLVKITTNLPLKKSKYSILRGGKIVIKSSFEQNENNVHLGVIPIKYIEDSIIITKDDIKFEIQQI
ncbi:MAG: CAF17-like 4Fe-4S cluster assembly/insertion protein YgfZ [Candidatus Poseidoniales archaeon]